MNNILYAQDKERAANGWIEVNGFGTRLSTFNFGNYKFRINGVVYEHESPEFDEALAKLQMWEQLSND